MKIKCIKTSGAHWGVFFKEGEWYDLEFTLKDYELITDKESYFNFLEEIAAYAKVKEITEDFKFEIEQLQQESNRYIIKVNLECGYVRGEDGTVHSFCFATKDYLKEKYGTSDFRFSINLFEDNFETINKVRSDILDTLIT